MCFTCGGGGGEHRSLLQIMILRHLQKSGHKPIVLLGGGTTKVGDPTGKDASRKMLSDGSVPFLLFALLAPSPAPSLAHANALAHLTFPAPPCELPCGQELPHARAPQDAHAREPLREARAREARVPLSLTRVSHCA